MKRNLTNVTEDHVRRLKRWVEIKAHNYCPFIGNGRRCSRDICYDVFPGIIDGRCPCSRYNFGYVKRVARQIIKELL